MRRWRTFAAVAAAGAMSTATASAANVVVNGTFDDTSGWTGSFTPQAGSGGTGGFPNIDTGTYYYGGSVSSNAISQTYQLTAADLAALATTGLDWTLSADLFGFSIQDDFSQVTVEFRDALGDGLGTVFLNSQTDRPDEWPDFLTAGDAPSFQEIMGVLPAMTTQILFVVSSGRVSGTSNDGYLDNLVFDITPSAVSSEVPIPAAALLFAPLAGLAMKRRRSA
ncbi:hypothetical protein [Parvularcula maris]|uniref:PEP-CTERM sorting domain-containing protein n=1 Tax=Parvularcula maris TaxID=2965077 RepID=A0A9X2RLJ3_9PROT|nr:hypothetical protein [Parvularcula maris]MCQ8186602.1 hypothetical protein [Parvularcula maris]